MAECRKCNGTKVFAPTGGVCFECNGSGEVNDVAYQTTPANESKHPSMRAKNEWEYDGRPLAKYPSQDCQCYICRKYEHINFPERFKQ